MLKTYKFKYLKGSIPGDQCVEWWTEKDWGRFRAHVAELKASGEYGKEEEVEITLVHDPAFDTLPKGNMSYEYQIIDLSNGK